MTHSLAMQRLIHEVRQVSPDATAEAREPDGYGISRLVVFDAETSAEISRAVEVVAQADRRVVSTGWLDDQLYVSLTPSISADHGRPFGLKAVHAQFEGEKPSRRQEEEEERRRGLMSLTRAELLEEHPDLADAKNKAEIVDRILASED